jgi:4'-phosphopantetheinyl transferase EntD
VTFQTPGPVRARPDDGADARDGRVIDPVLRRAIESLASQDVLVAHRLISPGDEFALLAEEAETITSRSPEARRASGAARMVARELLARLGHAPCALPKGATGAPRWPEGIVGSLAHDDRVALAAVATRARVELVGIDVEPTEALPPEMLDMVATRRERLRLDDNPFGGRLLFAAKEAVYKAVHPVDTVFLEFHDIDIDLAGRSASVRSGRTLGLRFCVSPRLVVLALA